MAEIDAALIARYRQILQNGAWDSLPNDRYIYQHLAQHLLNADLATELHDLLTASPAWMLKKLFLFGNHISYQADLELAIAQYHDPLSPEDYLKLIALHSVRQLFPLHKQNLRTELLRLGRFDDAIALCLALPSASHEKRNEDLGLRLRSLLRLYQSAQDLYGKDFYYPNLVKAIEGMHYEANKLPLGEQLSLKLAVAKLWYEIHHKNFYPLLNDIETQRLQMESAQERATLDFALFELYLEAQAYQQAEALIAKQGDVHYQFQLQTKLVPELVHQQRQAEALVIIAAQSSPNEKEKAQAEFAFALWQAGEEAACFEALQQLQSDKADFVWVRVLLYEIECRRFEAATNIIERIHSPKKRENWREHLRLAEQRARLESIATQEDAWQLSLHTLIHELNTVAEFDLAQRLLSLIPNSQPRFSEFNRVYNNSELEETALAAFKLGNFAEGLALCLHSDPEKLLTWHGYYLSVLQAYFKTDTARIVRESILIKTRIFGWFQPKWQTVYEALSTS